MGLTNPILDELSNLSPGAQAALAQAHQAAGTPAAAPGAAGMAPPAQAAAPGLIRPAIQHQQAIAAEAPPPRPMSAPMPNPVPQLGEPTPPPVVGVPDPRGTLAGDQEERSRLLGSGSGISQISGKVQGAMPNHSLLGKILGGAAQGVATVGDALLSPAIPAVLNKLPGTEEHHNILVKKATGDLETDEANAEKEAQTRNLDLQPQLREQAAALAQEKQNEVENYHAATTTNNQNKLQATLAQHGFAADEDHPGQLRPLRYEEMSPEQQAVADLKSAQEEQAQATAALRKAQNDPSSPAFRLAQERVRVAEQNAQTAIGRLGLSTEEFGFNQEKFFNPQPTATERTKGDLAQSALERIAEMRTIVKNHPEYFGPGAGRLTKAQAWLGSSDPDAATYQAAAQYLADHSAGVFGGRGQYILSELHSLTDQKYNPGALNATLDEAERAAQGFAKAGTVHGRGGGANAGGEGQGGGLTNLMVNDKGEQIGFDGRQWVDVKTRKAVQ